MYSAIEMLEWDIFFYFNLFILFYFLLLNSIYLIQVVISFFYIKQQKATLNVHQFPDIFRNELYKSISIIAPVYNEGKDLISTIQTLLQQRYGDFEVIVVNDGSTDNTLNYLKEHFELNSSNRHISDKLIHEPIKQIYQSRTYPNLMVIDKHNGHKADAMNAGLNAARKDLYCVIDGDSILERNELLKMLRSFADDDDVIAVGGLLGIRNGCIFEHGELKKAKTPSSFIACIQAVEYIRAFTFGRSSWELFNGLLIISGAFGVFDRRAVIKAGGYNPDALAEDIYIVMTLHKHFSKNKIPYRIVYQPEPICWTDVPDNWAALSAQRSRWQKILLETLWHFREMIFNPKYGLVGMLTVPFFVIFELFGAFIELLGYVIIAGLLITGLLPPVTGFLFFLAAILFGVFLSVCSLLCQQLINAQYPRLKDLFKLLFVSIFESFGYRQLHTWWRSKGMITYMFGSTERKQQIANSRLINALYWVVFILINACILYLIYYGVTDGKTFL